MRTPRTARRLDGSRLPRFFIIAALASAAILCCLHPQRPLLGAEGAKRPSPPVKKAEAKPPRPEKVLAEMCDFLKSLKEFSFKAEVTDDRVYRGGKKLQFGFDMESFVRRPDRLRVDADGDLENKQFFYDGATITLYEKTRNVYASIPVPAGIDAALEKADRDFGLRVALTDLAAGSACAMMTKGARPGLYVGLHRVRGTECHHLSFDRRDIQWQIWIEAGAKPLPRKIVITQKNLPASPQWTAYLYSWNLAPRVSDAVFVFTPPKGASRIKFVPRAKPSAGAQQTGEAQTKGGGK